MITVFNRLHARRGITFACWPDAFGGLLMHSGKACCAEVAGEPIAVAFASRVRLVRGGGRSRSYHYRCVRLCLLLPPYKLVLARILNPSFFIVIA